MGTWVKRGSCVLAILAVTVQGTLIQKQVATADPDMGSIVFRSNHPGNEELYSMDGNGSHVMRLTFTSRFAEFNPALSPDGTRVAFAAQKTDLASAEIFVMNVDGTARVKLTSNSTQDSYPTWSPDGTKLAFVSTRDGDGEIYAMNADGSDQHDVSNFHAANEYDPNWSSDGSKFAFVSDRSGVVGTKDVFVMDADGSNAMDVSNDPGTNFAPEWSPDGTRIAFRNDRTGNFDIYTMNADGSGQVDLTTNPAVDRQPSWSPDGTRIAFATDRDGNYEIYSIRADGSSPTNLTKSPFLDNMPDWGVRPAG